MVGSCPHCNRPWYAGDDKPVPTSCRGCGKPIYEPQPVGRREAAADADEAAAHARFDAAREVGHIQTEQAVAADRAASFQSGRLFMAVGGVAVLIAALWAADTARFQNTATRVTGTVDAEEHWRSNKGYTKTIFNIKYAAGGKTQVMRTGGNYKHGDAVPLLIAADDPTDARLPTGLYENKIGVACLGGLVMLLGVFVRPWGQPAALTPG